MNQTPAPWQFDDPACVDIDAERVDHLLIVKAFADDLDLVDTINRLAPTQMGVGRGIIVLGLVLDTLSGRSPLYRLEEFFEGRDTELLLGERVRAAGFNDDTVGRVLDLLFEVGTQQIFSEFAMKAIAQHNISTRAVQFDTTSVDVYGEYRVNDAGQLNLVKECYNQYGRHSFAEQNTSEGPNAFVNCRAETNFGESGPRHGWTTAALYDNLTVTGINIHVKNWGLSFGRGLTGANCAVGGRTGPTCPRRITWRASTQRSSGPHRKRWRRIRRR